jgi:hypothetical protein
LLTFLQIFFFFWSLKIFFYFLFFHYFRFFVSINNYECILQWKWTHISDLNAFLHNFSSKFHTNLEFNNNQNYPWVNKQDEQHGNSLTVSLNPFWKFWFDVRNIHWTRNWFSFNFSLRWTNKTLFQVHGNFETHFKIFSDMKQSLDNNMYEKFGDLELKNHFELVINWRNSIGWH